MTLSGGASSESRPAHRDGNVLRWLTAYATSAVGDNVCFLALGWAAQDVASPAQVGMVMATSAVPRALLMLGGGVAADRFGPRPVLISSDAVRCAVVLTLAAWFFLATPDLWLLVAGAFVFGVVDALFMPAIGALPPRITTRSQLSQVQGMRTLVIRIGNISGPPLGGYVMGTGGVPAALALAGALFAVSLPLLLTVRIAPLAAPGATGSLRGEGRAGDRFERTGRRAPLPVPAPVARAARTQRRTQRVRPERAAQHRPRAARRGTRLGRFRYGLDHQRVRGRCGRQCSSSSPCSAGCRARAHFNLWLSWPHPPGSPPSGGDADAERCGGDGVRVGSGRLDLRRTLERTHPNHDRPRIPPAGSRL